MNESRTSAPQCPGRGHGAKPGTRDSIELSSEMRTYARDGRLVHNPAERTGDPDASEHTAVHHGSHGLGPTLVARHEQPALRLPRSFFRDGELHEDLCRHLHHVTARKPCREENHRSLTERRCGLYDVGRRLHGTRSQVQRSRKKITVALPHRGEREVRRVPQFDRSASAAHVPGLSALCGSCF